MGFPINLYINGKQYKQESSLLSLSVIMQVKRWAEDAIMIADDYTTQARGSVGQFCVIQTYTTDDNLNWSGSWSAVSQFSRLNYDDIMKLANTQLLPFAYPWGMSYSDIISVMDVVLPDGYTLRAKMGWLINTDGFSSSRPSSPMWSNGDWWKPFPNGNALEVRYGTMVYGGQQVCVSKDLFFLDSMNMRELKLFSRSDWGKTFSTHPFLMEHATVATYPSNGYGDYPRGYVQCPVALNPKDFGFSGIFNASRYFIPDKWLKSL